MDDCQDFGCNVGRELVSEDVSKLVDFNARTTLLHHAKVVLSSALLHARLIR